MSVSPRRIECTDKKKRNARGVGILLQPNNPNEMERKGILDSSIHGK